MKMFDVDVWNINNHYYDSYLVMAESAKGARAETRARLDNETDEGSAGWAVLSASPRE